MAYMHCSASMAELRALPLRQVCVATHLHPETERQESGSLSELTILIQTGETFERLAARREHRRRSVRATFVAYPQRPG